ncbi:MAG: tetratricopeptide repeat protein, partial [Gammaproteobacteria bacterium]
GELLLEKYNNEEALQAFRQVLDKNDAHPRALLGLARSQHFDYSSEAVTTALRALSINPNLVPARIFLARLFIELEQYADARHEVDLALEINPQSLEAMTLLAATHLLQRDRAAFEQIERRVLQTNPKYAHFYTLVADIAAQNRLYREAADFAATAVELDPQSWRGHGLLGMNLLRLGQMQAGRESLERSFEGDPYNVWIKNTLQLADTFGDYVEIEQGRFIVVIHGDEDALLRQYVHDLAIEAYAYFRQRYRHEPEGLIRIEFYPDHADFSVRTVGLAGVGLLGVCFGPVVAMDSPAARERGAFNWGSTLWHELAHVFHMSMTDNRVPRWFTEGLSVYEERLARSGWGADPDPEFLRAHLQGRLLPVSSLNNGFVRPSYPEQVVHSYYQASLVLEFIESRWGFDVVRDILDGYRHSFDADAVLLEHLELDYERLNADFDAYFRDRFASALAALGDLEEALPTPDPEQPPLATEVPANYFAQMRFANLMLEQDNFELAELFLLNAQQLFPQYAGDDSSYWLLAELYAKQQKWDQAERQLEQLVSINAEHYTAHRRLAELRARRNDHAGAVKVLRAANYIYPYDPEMHRQHAQHAANLDDWPSVVRARRALVALDPVDRAQAFYQLAYAYQRAGDRSSAREQILYALEIAPNYTLAQELLLSLHAAQESRE